MIPRSKDFNKNDIKTIFKNTKGSESLFRDKILAKT